jgi:hypothetical protein
MKRREKNLVVIAAIAGAAVIAVAAWNSNRSRAADDSGKSATVRVQREKMKRTLLVSGELAPVRAVRISVPRFRERNSVPIQAMAAEGSIVNPGDAAKEKINASANASAGVSK